MNTYEKPLKVLVCGTNFGRVYLKGLERCGDKFKIAGIFSHGSTQSKQEAEKYGVPLITDLNEVSKKDFDMACVVIRSTAVGGKGTEIAGALLEKGIHVIQEHPVHYNDIVKLLKVAKENNCVYQVNSFYPNVKNVQEFIVKSNKLLKKSRPTYIDATCSTQVLFPMISILGKALSVYKSLRELHLHGVLAPPCRSFSSTLPHESTKAFIMNMHGNCCDIFIWRF